MASSVGAVPSVGLASSAGFSSGAGAMVSVGAGFSPVGAVVCANAGKLTAAAPIKSICFNMKFSFRGDF